MNIFNNSSFNTFPGIYQNLPENVSIFFAKMIDLRLLTQKNQTLYGIIGRNIALWQNLWVGVGRTSSARTRVACAQWPVQSIPLAIFLNHDAQSAAQTTRF